MKDYLQKVHVFKKWAGGANLYTDLLRLLVQCGSWASTRNRSEMNRRVGMDPARELELRGAACMAHEVLLLGPVEGVVLPGALDEYADEGVRGPLRRRRGVLVRAHAAVLQAAVVRGAALGGARDASDQCVATPPACQTLS